MTTRRNFLKGGTAAATGIVFCSCGLLQSAHAQPAGSRTLPVSIGGKRVKTIDVHAHCHFREAGALLPEDQRAAAQLPPVNGAAEAFIEIDQRLKAMDSQAVDMEVLSINPFWYGRERDLAAQIVKVQNEKLAELCASKPDRFAAFASLTLQAPDLAVTELETAVKKQGLKGAAIGGMVNGVEFSDPKFHPVWAKAEELGVPLFHRHARGLILTEQGEMLFRTADEVWAKLEAARNNLADSHERPTGQLRITTTVALGTTWLTQRCRGPVVLSLAK